MALLEQLVEKPSLLALDDFDRMSAEDQGLVRSLIERALTLREKLSRSRKRVHLPILVLAASPERLGDSELGAIWRRFHSLPWSSVHVLGPWSDEEANLYLQSVLCPGRDLGAAEELLRREAAGNPGRFQLLLKELARSGALRLQESTWRCDLGAVQEGVELPGERQRFLREWSRLDGVAHGILALCALHSDPEARVTVDVLASALGKREQDVRRSLEEILASEVFLTPEAALASGRSQGPRLSRLKRAWILRQHPPQARRSFRIQLAGSPVPPAEKVYQKLRIGHVPLAEVLEAAGSGGAVE